jgi:ketosteroid isomerase-like protein
MSHDQLVDRYLAAITDPRTDGETLDRLIHPGYTFREWPNAINPAGTERDRATSMQGLAASRTMLRSHAFEVHEHVVSGDTVASRMTWRGTMAIDAGPLKAGTELVAHVSQHTTIRDGQILRTESFDCYEPF